MTDICIVDRGILGRPTIKGRLLRPPPRSMGIWNYDGQLPGPSPWKYAVADAYIPHEPQGLVGGRGQAGGRGERGGDPK